MSYITIDQAIAEYRLTCNEIKALIQSGNIKTDTLNDDTTILRRIDVARASADKHVHREDFTHLQGVSIATGDAAEKYKIRQSTIQKWCRKGWVKILGIDPQNKAKWLVNEADIAYIHAISEITGITIGRATIKPD